MQSKTIHFILVPVIAATAFAIATTARTQSAEACGCFAPPDPSVPVVQAGERIVFDIENGSVTAHIQVQAAGNADTFGWLLPMPSIPELAIGTDELFTVVTRQTQPRYRVNYTYNGNCPFDPSRFNNSPSSDSAGGDGDGDGDGEGGILVSETIIGPYEAAILEASEKQPMLDWLTANDYFIPAGTEELVDAYIHEGAYMVALKLRKGATTAEVQPVVVKYKSDLPMIPIILTAVAAQADMGVQVWVLGESRAIPRNFNHTVINDARIEWQNFGQNYAEVVTKAVDEAEGHHSFVTEYAGSTDVMANSLMYDGRFGDPNELRGIFDPITFISRMNQTGFLSFDPQTGIGAYTRETLAVMDRYLPLPPQLEAQGLSAAEYYNSIEYYLGQFRDDNPELFADADLDYDPAALTTDLVERVIDPTRAAQELFNRNSKMTRLFTTLSPHEMVKDPVFSFNRDLPEVSNEHLAEGTYFCGIGGFDDPATTPTRLVTEYGFVLDYPDGTGVNPFESVDMPWALQTQILREEGDPIIVDDNNDRISSALNVFGGGCSIGGSNGTGATLLLILGVLLLGNRRRRRQ